MTNRSWAAWTALLVFTMGTSIITPLFPLYQDRFDLGNGAVTFLFAVYSIAVVPTMLVMGNLSDRFGRKRVIIPALTAMTLGSLVMGLADSVPWLIAGRVLQGIAVGSMLGVGTAFVVDHARNTGRARAAEIAGLGFRLGFGLGPGLAGIVSHSTGNSIHIPFLMHAGVMVVAFAAILAIPETIQRTRAPLRIDVGVPSGQLVAFATFLAPAIFLMSFLDATLLSVVPLYMVEELGVTNVAVIGLVGFLILGMGGVTPFLFGGLDPRRAVILGTSTSAVASLLVVAAAGADSPLLVIVAAGAIGLINGLILQGATTICGISVPREQRGRLISALYMCAYSGTIPTVGLGYLSQGIGLTGALVVFSAIAIAIATFVSAVGRRNYRVVIPYVDRPAGAPA